jgi:hypothetical protein
MVRNRSRWWKDICNIYNDQSVMGSLLDNNLIKEIVDAGDTLFGQ